MPRKHTAAALRGSGAGGELLANEQGALVLGEVASLAVVHFRVEQRHADIDRQVVEADGAADAHEGEAGGRVPGAADEGGNDRNQQQGDLQAVADEVDLIRSALPEFDLESFNAGHLTPVYFGSAMKDIGVGDLLDGLADAGYDCGLVGKLHLTAAKYYEKRPDDGYRMFLWSHHPTPDSARGHDYENWLRHEKKIDPVELYAPVNHFCGAGVPTEYHQTTWLSEMATRFITEQRDGPWLLSLNPFDPHAPFDAPAEYLAKVSAESLPYPLFRDSDIERQKAFVAIDQQNLPL